MRDAGDLPDGKAGKVEQSVKDEIQTAIDALKKVKDGEDISAIKSAEDALSKTIQKIGEAMYKKDGGADAKEKKDEPNVKDADYKDVDKDKK